MDTYPSDEWISTRTRTYTLDSGKLGSKRLLRLQTHQYLIQAAPLIAPAPAKRRRSAGIYPRHSETGEATKQGDAAEDFGTRYPLKQALAGEQCRTYIHDNVRCEPRRRSLHWKLLHIPSIYFNYYLLCGTATPVPPSLTAWACMWATGWAAPSGSSPSSSRARWPSARHPPSGPRSPCPAGPRWR
jgi:hypothetical protein